MDEAGFQLAFSRKTIKVAPKSYTKSQQARAESSEHVTVVAAIGESWFNNNKDVSMRAIVTDSGWSNDYIALKWLIEVFDPATKDRAQTEPRILFLDGHDSHVKVDFIKACLERNIYVCALPANMSSYLQPLDVNYSSTLKLYYTQQIELLHMGAQDTMRVTKGMFWGWFQEAWRATAGNTRLIRSAWRESGLWPLNKEVMAPGVENEQSRATTPPTAQGYELKTPLTQCTYARNKRALRRSDVTQGAYTGKLDKAFELVLAEKEVAEREITLLKRSQKLLETTTGSRKAVRYPRGKFFDPSYATDHLTELLARQAVEEERREKRRVAAEEKRRAQRSNVREGR
ncbi:protein of unknown function [Taphrina deformans PYCC 5710]|uniref:DDE-1 domain-containing protein n=1 Tax=Taphrina deformans (strain PYCC 5710 / ATCC 11124 / CBS 356.35 / IMI 108563 / JCM 9778 / NBRC 8474) TaxID=1097556 RepID=R4XD60_TAPDE|nr:protein of unknown function [Taphrina deformans PYCC 5710]|eukprot:CCG82343.1 protein of unknown function [Taphrina deformans PYCC 5710]